MQRCSDRIRYKDVVLDLELEKARAEQEPSGVRRLRKRVWGCEALAHVG